MTTSARVVLLAGPSGAGKSRLAHRLHTAHGWPVVRLDDFYRDGDDPGLPMLSLGIPDWDDPRSWRADEAVAALRDLVTTGAAAVPAYDISASRGVGTHEVTAPPGGLIVAEGVFAAEIARALDAEGLLAAAYCVVRNRWVTFGYRLRRDLADRRKPPLILIRRGLRLCRREPMIIARAIACGATARTPARVERELAERLHPAG